jgi:hypothetical protein
MIAMTNPVAALHGALPRVESVVPTCAPAWKQQRPAGVILGGFGADNNTGVSAEERRHL